MNQPEATKLVRSQPEGTMFFTHLFVYRKTHEVHRTGGLTIWKGLHLEEDKKFLVRASDLAIAATILSYDNQNRPWSFS